MMMSPKEKRNLFVCVSWGRESTFYIKDFPQETVALLHQRKLRVCARFENENRTVCLQFTRNVAATHATRLPNSLFIYLLANVWAYILTPKAIISLREFLANGVKLMRKDVKISERKKVLCFNKLASPPLASGGGRFSVLVSSTCEDNNGGRDCIQNGWKRSRFKSMQRRLFVAHVGSFLFLLPFNQSSKYIKIENFGNF